MLEMVGDEWIIMDCGELLEKGTTKFRHLAPPLASWLLLDDEVDDAQLTSNSAGSGMTGNDGQSEVSPTVNISEMGKLGREREKRRDWDGGGEKSVHGGSLGHFIGSGDVSPLGSPPMMAGMRRWWCCSIQARIFAFSIANIPRGIETSTWRSMMMRWSWRMACRGGLAGGALSSMQGRRGRRWCLPTVSYLKRYRAGGLVTGPNGWASAR
jgi:hypothetical protein